MSTNVLKQLITGRLFSELILIEDNEYFSGSALLENFIKSNLSRDNTVHFLTYEKHRFLQNLASDHLFVHDCCFYPAIESESRLGSPDWLRSLIKPNQFNVVVIDSLSFALLGLSLKAIGLSLKSLKDTNNEHTRTQIITCVTDSNESSSELKDLEQLAKSVIRLDLTDKGNRVSICHKKPGKTLREVCSLSFKQDRTLEMNPITEDKRAPIEPAVTPISTFKLSLDDSEKESRSQVILPYLKNTGKGKIYYEPDPNDDWDEEDPDEDLEI